MDLVRPVNVLVVNAGSSSLKLRLLGYSGEIAAETDVERWHGTGHIAEFVAGLPAGTRVDAVGHRVVHGGAAFTGPVVVDDGVRDGIAALADLAPLHQPRALAGIDAARAALPAAPSVACFDTAFHAGLPDAAATYALPADWRRRWSLRRYGFHGLSHGYVARRARELAPPAARLVSCHLGAGASLCAVLDGRSVDTTMGFTPLEGLVMATRSGTVDPGLLLWLLAHGDLDVDRLTDALERRSGLAALAELPSGSGDLRDVHAAAVAGGAPAALALRVYVHRLRAAVAAMTAALGGLDTLAFTGGTGEHDPWVRAQTVAGLRYLGLELDDRANRGCRPDAEIGAAGSRVRILVLAAREDLEIATQVRAVLGATRRPGSEGEPIATPAP